MKVLTFMRLHISVVIAVVALNVGCIVHAQSQTNNVLEIGGFELRLGMPQVEALQLLGTVYDVRPLENALPPGGWIVLRRGVTPTELIGSLGFTGGRLSSVSRTWGGSGVPEASTFASSVIDALRSATRSGSGCAITTETIPAPGGDGAQQARIRCGARVVDIVGARSGPVRASVSETIRTTR